MKQQFALACLALAISAGLGTMVAAAPAADSGDPIDLFARMYPVFSHDRCTGCHGRVIPYLETGNNHGPGQIPEGGQPCNDCHAPPGWKIRPDITFFNKSVKEICQMQSRLLRGMRASSSIATTAMVNTEYLKHLANDHLVGSAFDGDRGGASSRVDKPPISRNEFVKAAQEWLNAGAGCGGWEGTITQTENFASSYSYPWTDFPEPSRIAVNEQAQRIVTINRSDGQTTIKINQGGRSKMTRTAHMDGANGPCVAVYTNVEDWTGQNNAEVPADLKVRIAGDGSYTIYFHGPVEKTLTTQTGDMTSDCGIPPMHSADSVVLDWPVWKHTIRCPSDFGICQKFDPDSNHLSGTATRTLMNHEDAADPHSWLEVSPVGISRADDGSSLPVKVKTTWDLTLKQ
ncbi:MAG: hypothetical protein WBO00_06050 [Steroidobacteraceae bacterium]